MGPKTGGLGEFFFHVFRSGSRAPFWPHLFLASLGLILAPSGPLLALSLLHFGLILAILASLGALLASSWPCLGPLSCTWPLALGSLGFLGAFSLLFLRCPSRLEDSTRFPKASGMWKPEQPHGSRCGTRGEASETLQRSGKPWDFAQGPALAILGLGRPPPFLALSQASDPPSWH